MRKMLILLVVVVLALAFALVTGKPSYAQLPNPPYFTPMATATAFELTPTATPTPTATAEPYPTYNPYPGPNPTPIPYPGPATPHQFLPSSIGQLFAWLKSWLFR